MNEPMNIFEGWYNRDLTPITTDEQLIAASSIESRRVAETTVGDLGWVSTVFLRLDHRFLENDGPPILFETLVFGGKLSDEMERYCTEEEALAGHERMVERVRKTASLWSRIRGWFKRKPKHVHTWSKWEDTGQKLTKESGLHGEYLLGSTLHRRHCDECGASDRAWV